VTVAVWPYSTANWRRLRAAKLAEHPLCEVCEKAGRIVVASHVDHQTPISLGGDPFPPLSGLTAMCHSCHSIKTNRVDKPLMRPPKGCDASGAPADPRHPFFAKAGEGGRRIAGGAMGIDRRGPENRVSWPRGRRRKWG
jgi:5-methylcytosine-specific restriction protein A